MKEDILEQLVDDYLQLSGFFTIHNVKFRPAQDDPGYVTSQDCVYLDDIYKKVSKTPASSEVGRLLQVIKASGWKP